MGKVDWLIDAGGGGDDGELMLKSRVDGHVQK